MRKESVEIFSLKGEVLGTKLFADDLDHKIPDQSIVPHNGIEVDLLGNLGGGATDFLYQTLVVQGI